MEIVSDRELWAFALWVEKHHPDDGPHYIADQIARMALDDDKEAVAMWLKVAERFGGLRQPEILHRDS